MSHTIKETQPRDHLVSLLILGYASTPEADQFIACQVSPITTKTKIAGTVGELFNSSQTVPATETEVFYLYDMWIGSCRERLTVTIHKNDAHDVLHQKTT